MWLSFRRPCEEKGKTPGFYLEIGAEDVSFGMGFYALNRPLMNALRRRMRLAPEEPAAICAALAGEFTLYGEAYRRLAVPEELPKILRPLYVRKASILKKRCPFPTPNRRRWRGKLAKAFCAWRPLYAYVRACPPEEEDFQ